MGVDHGWSIAAHLEVGDLAVVDAALALAVEREQDRARALFADLCALAGPLGLYAEEYEPGRKLALGNYPQAYSHLALLDTARRLAPAGR